MFFLYKSFIDQRLEDLKLINYVSVECVSTIPIQQIYDITSMGILFLNSDVPMFYYVDSNKKSLN